jgi:hypothetical protein
MLSSGGPTVMMAVLHLFGAGPVTLSLAFGGHGCLLLGFGFRLLFGMSGRGGWVVVETLADGGGQVRKGKPRKAAGVPDLEALWSDADHFTALIAFALKSRHGEGLARVGQCSTEGYRDETGC